MSQENKELFRLQKFLAKAGICSRRKGEEYIKDGFVSVNDQAIFELGTKVDPDNDRVKFKGKIVKLQKKLLYIALNKPEGYISSCVRRYPGEKIVLDLFAKIDERIYPVGRLDKESHGLLLMTNDGRIHHKLSHPSFDHEKEYEVVVKKEISDDDLSVLAKGILLDSKKTRPAIVKRISKDFFKIILQEGRNRQIRRMVQKISNQVISLKRIRIANIKLKDLEKGKWRYLFKQEQKDLFKKLQIK